MKPFKSDGCSFWPDGEFKGCCYYHDRLYWEGGSWRDRLSADNKLFACVREKSRFGIVMASVMWIGVRLFGGPYWPAGHRWGYGYQWPKYRHDQEYQDTHR